MTRVLFALREDADLAEGIDPGPVRALLEENSEFSQVENIIFHLLPTNDFLSLARVIRNFIHNIEHVSIEILDENTEKIQIQDLLLNLQITTFICLASMTTEERPQIYRFGYTIDGNPKFCKNIDEFVTEIGTFGKTLTNSEYEALFDSKSNLENMFNGKIITHNVTDKNDSELHCYCCTSPGCTASVTSIEEFRNHIETCHQDQFSFLEPIWSDILRYAIQHNRIPTVSEFFKPLFLGGIFTDSSEGQSKHVFIDQNKYDLSKANAEKLARDNVISFECKICQCTQTILIDDQSPFKDLIKSSLNDYELEYNELEEPTSLNEVDFRTDIINDYILEYEDIEESINATENEELIIINPNNISDFIHEITERLKESNLKNDIDELRDFILQHQIENHLAEQLLSDDNTPIILVYLMKLQWLPKPGYSSPFPPETNDLRTPANLATYIARKDPRISCSTRDRCSIYFASVLDDSIPFAVYENERPDIDNPIHFCPYLDCNYGTQNPKQMSSHIGSRIHSNGHKKMAELGPFWTPQQDFAIKHNRLPEISIIKRDVQSFKCTRCNMQFLRLNDMNNHHIKKHNLSMTSITDNLTKIGEIKLISKDDIINIKNEIERETRSALARPLVEDPTPRTQEPEPNTNTNNATIEHQNTQTEPVAEHNSPGNLETQNENDNDESAQHREETDLEDVNNILDMTLEVSNTDLVQKALEWIRVFQDEEDNRNIGIPTMNVERRKRIKKDLKSLYTITLIPLMEKFMPIDDSEDETFKFDGVMYKINHEIREHCIRNLLLTRQQVYNRERSNNTLNERQLRRQEEIRRYINAASLTSDSAKMAKILIEMRDISKTENRGQVEENRYNKLKLKAISIIENRRDIFENPIAGEEIESLMSIQEDQFNRVLDWLQSKIDESSQITWKESNKIQKMYEDNPRKTLNHYVWPKTTPKCDINPQTFAEHYGRAWADETQHYEDPTEDPQWNIDKTVTENNDLRLKEFICNEKKIKDIISTRNHLSAHGKDGISNSIFRLAKKEAAKLFSLIFKAILITKHIPTSWKRTKTIMLYKKGDPSRPENWRPIGLTSTMYRIFSATLASFILSENKINPVFHPSQKGFIGGSNGSKEHISTLNELIYYARRNNQKAIMITIDLTNAFGNVPHQLIFDTLQRKGFSNDLINIIQDIYNDNTTCIEVDGSRSENIPQRRGVLQGCPLSPLLFNCCIDPMLTHLERFNKNDGISYLWQDKHYTVVAQAYADDLVLVANDETSAQNMIKELVEYCRKTSLTIAPHKCTAIVEGFEQIPTIQINDTDIPVIEASKTILYLGAPISGNKASKISLSKEKVKVTKNKIKLVFNSPLTLSQKIHAIKTFVLPYLDYTLTNSIFAARDLAEIDSLIRGKIARDANTSRIPKEYAHISGKFGGLGIPSLKNKADKLKISNFIGQLISKEEHIRALAELTIEEEKTKRGIVTNDEDRRFLSFQFGGESGTQLCQSNHGRGTNCAMLRAIQGAMNLNICINRNNDKIELTHNEETRVPRNIRETNEIIESFIQNDLLSNIRTNPTHGHSFTGVTTKSSHSYRNGTAIIDKLFKFIIKSRTNTLPTKANLSAWHHNTDDSCQLCGNRDTLNHVLNSCHRRSNLYTWRHNIVVQRIVEEINKEYSPTEILQSCILRIDGLSPENQRLMPDITAKLQDEMKYIIVEVTLPYNQETKVNDVTENTLSERQNDKFNKYHSLVEEIERETGYEVEYYTIVISSLGHVTDITESNLIRLFGRKRGKKLSEELSMLAIKGSACIFYNKPPEAFGLITRDPWPNAVINENNHNINTDDLTNFTFNLSVTGGEVSSEESVENTNTNTTQYESDIEETDNMMSDTHTETSDMTDYTFDQNQLASNEETDTSD